MSADPFVTLVVEALNLMHPRFAAVNGLTYQAEEPAAGSKWREQPVVMEFYHQFRHLWDRALPVQLGLGHLMLWDDPARMPVPDFLFWQLGENGRPDTRLGAVSLVLLSNAAVIDKDLGTLRLFRNKQGYPHAVCVIVGRTADIPASGLPETPGVTTLFFDTDRWRVTA